jgi:peptidoglycan L-alanyl-D-glutamate endopeptidase CwlK
LEEQDVIYDSGRTENGHIVSWATPGKSIHNYGFAVDVVDRWRGYYINWKRLAKIGEFCGLEQVDDAHFEHRGGLATEQFSAGERPSPRLLPCDIMSERAKANQSLTLADLQGCQAPDFLN